MSSRLNLNDNISDVFGFTIAGLDYDLRYPTMGELDPIRELNIKMEEARANNDDEKVEKLTEEMNDIFYGFIVPVGHATPIEETLKKVSLPVMKAFNKMVIAQFQAE